MNYGCVPKCLFLLWTLRALLLPYFLLQKEQLNQVSISDTFLLLRFWSRINSVVVVVILEGPAANVLSPSVITDSILTSSTVTAVDCSIRWWTGIVTLGWVMHILPDLSVKVSLPFRR